jgi:thiol reductant ABC exporter CydC subunit
MRNLLRVFKEERNEMLAAVILSGASLGAAVGLLATSAWLISMASTQPPVLVLEVAIVSVRFFGLSRGVLKYISRILEHNSALKIQTTLRVKIYERFSRLLPQDFVELKRGNTLSRIFSDVELAQDLWLRIASPWLAGMISGVAGISIIHWLLPVCGKVLALLFLASVFLIPFLAMISSSKSESRKVEGELFDHILQISESAPESLIFNYDQILISQVTETQTEIAKIELQNSRRSGFASAMYFLALGLSEIVALWFAATALSQHRLAGINVAVIVLVPLAIFDGISSLPGAFSQLRQVIGAIENIEPLIHAKAGIEQDIEWPIQLQAHLELHQVLPLIPGAAVREISAEVNPGEALVISGKSGAGKSSIINAILGFVPFQGSIRINDRELSAADQSLISTLLQDDYLFSTSIRENLKIGKPDATNDELLSVLKIVELEPFVTALPDGLDTMVGPLGFNFSGGEKQRLRLARLLLRDTPIFILDEPFEFLDSQMVERITRKVLLKLSDRTLVIVSHLPLPTENLPMQIKVVEL